MSDTVDSVSPAFQEQRRLMRLPNDLMGGTAGMIAAGKRYIPLEAGEDEKAWSNRVNRATLYNVYKRTLRYLCGRVFEKPVSLAEGADERFAEFCEDVDMRGQNITTWGRHVFEAGINDGVTFCVADFNGARTRRNGGGVEYMRSDGSWALKTEAADRENGWRPYFIHVNAANVLDCRLEWRAGKPVITHFRYIENAEIADGKWGTQSYQLIRAFYLDESGKPVWEVWSNFAEMGGAGAWFLRDAGAFSLDALPIAIFMPGEKKTEVTAEPALIDLAHLNKRHWQATCGQYELMEFVRRPPWFGKCLGEFDAQSGRTKIVFGPGKLCHAADANALLQSVGVDPASVAAGSAELKDLENRMAIYGLQLLQPKTGNMTATESLRDSEENNSTLKAWALQFQDFLENCMALVGQWWKMADGPGVVVNTDFANSLDASLFLDLYQAQGISRFTLLTQMKSLGFLPDDFGIEDEQARIEAEIKGGEGPSGVADAARSLFNLAGRVEP